MKKIYSFKIDCLPPSVNHLYRTTWRTGKPIFYKEPKVKDFEEMAGWQLKKLKTPISGDLELEVIFIFEKQSTFKRRDLDNCLKLTQDVLKEYGIIEDDNQIIKIVCEKQIGKKDQILGSLLQ